MAARLPELNAIDQVWGCIKQHIRSSLQQFARVDLQAMLEEARLCITEVVWAGAVLRSRAFEDEFHTLVMDPALINLDSDNEDDLLLHSDEDYNKTHAKQFICICFK